MIDEEARLDRIGKAHDTHADFDGVLARYTGRIVAPQTKGLCVLEAGCSTGVITELLLNYAAQLDVVEGAVSYAALVENRFHGKLRMFRSLFEEFRPPTTYETVVFAGVLHHLKDPVAKLRMAAEWVRPGGTIHISVPNMSSFHRRLGVAMGVAASIYNTSKRNEFFEQPGRFTKERLIQAVTDAGLKVQECHGFFFKPFPHDIMSSLELTEDLLDGLFEMGKQYPDMACQLYLRAERL
jgi:2-polyprenyl-3-methyl-5-hydroxy-6-metoxy-1,4-benzoquinol methylase